ncbi:hypothetical protein BG004_006271, partial [Podila humilis]
FALTQPDDHLQPDDTIDQDRNDLHHLNDDVDGYLTDSSLISSGDMSDPFTTRSRTRLLRRAISLEDLPSTASIHRQLRSPELLHQSPLPTAPNSKNHSSQTKQSPIVSSPPRQASSTSAPVSTIARTIEHMEFVPLKDRPQPDHDQEQGQELELGHDTEPHPLDRDRRDATNFPTPDVSPEELSDSSEDIILEQGNMLSGTRTMRSYDGPQHRHRPQQHQQKRHHSYPEPGTRDPVSTAEGDSLQDPNSWGWLKDSPFLDALVNWIEGPETPSQQKNQEKDKPNPWLDIPFQFIALLTYPEPDPKTGNKMTLGRKSEIALPYFPQNGLHTGTKLRFSFVTIVVRETAFVRQRRKTLLMLTAYTLLVRYCSFDFFLVVLFASNCAMLFLMKNSGRMNVNMAKRAVRQRVGWAKQWAGNIFKRGGNYTNNNIINSLGSGSGISSGMPTPSLHGRSSSIHHYHHLRGASQTALSVNASQVAEPTRDMQGLAGGSGVSLLSMAPETSPQMKRRGLFGKKVAVGNSNSAHSLANSPSTTDQGTFLNNDNASIMTATTTVGTVTAVPTTTSTVTTKRRFFRRNQNSGINCNASILLSTPIPIQSVPVSKESSSLLSPTLAKTVIPNAPLSSSPLTQSQSLPQLQFSPQKIVSPSGTGPIPVAAAAQTLPVDEQESSSSSNSNSNGSSSHGKKRLTQAQAQAQRSSLQLNTKIQQQLHMSAEPLSYLATPSPSTPPLFSGLSQLLNRSSSPSTPSTSSPSCLASAVVTPRVVSSPSPTLLFNEQDQGEEGSGILLDVETELDKIFSGAKQQESQQQQPMSMVTESGSSTIGLDDQMGNKKPQEATFQVVV